MGTNTKRHYAPLMTVDEVAEFLNVSRRQVYNLLRDGRISPPVRVGNRLRFDPEKLRASLREAPVPASTDDERPAGDGAQEGNR